MVAKSWPLLIVLSPLELSGACTTVSLVHGPIGLYGLQREIEPGGIGVATVWL